MLLKNSGWRGPYLLKTDIHGAMGYGESTASKRIDPPQVLPGARWLGGINCARYAAGGGDHRDVTGASSRRAPPRDRDVRECARASPGPRGAGGPSGQGAGGPGRPPPPDAPGPGGPPWPSSGTSGWRPGAGPTRRRSSPARASVAGSAMTIKPPSPSDAPAGSPAGIRPSGPSPATTASSPSSAGPGTRSGATRSSALLLPRGGLSPGSDRRVLGRPSRSAPLLARHRRSRARARPHAPPC